MTSGEASSVLRAIAFNSERCDRSGMTLAHSQQILALLGEILLVACLLLGTFRLRAWLGLAPLFVAIGSLQFLQTALASSICVEVAPGILVSPGSVVLF